MKIGYVLIGLYKNENFAYARAALVPNLKISLITESKAQELGCLERLEQKYILSLGSIGLANTEFICSIDSISTVEHRWKIKTVLYVVEDKVLEKLKCEAALGMDFMMLLGHEIAIYSTG